MTTLLVAGQKFRFKGLDSILRAKRFADELQGACKRNGAEIELTCDTVVEFRPRLTGPSARIENPFPLHAGSSTEVPPFLAVVRP